MIIASLYNVSKAKKDLDFIQRIILTLLNFIILTSTYFMPIEAKTKRTPSIINDSPKEVLDQVWQIVYSDYMNSNEKYNTKNWLELRKKLLSNKYDDFDHAYEAIRGMLSSLDDPYTRFMDPIEFKEMRIDTSGELTGIGIQISIDEKTNNVIVISPIEGTPAYKAGLKAQDIIVGINGKSIKGMSIDNVVKLIRGKKGTKIILEILRGDDYNKIAIIRDRIAIRTVTSRLNKSNQGINIGYIRIKQFSANASKEMREVILSFEKQNIDAYVIDLRGNPGGLLESSIDISRQLLNQGIIVSTESKDGIQDIRRATGNALTFKPIALLVNEGSASASEILSGALQDNNRGFLVGKRTFGKGLVQSVRTLVDGSGLTVTVAKYLTPNGTDIHKNGIKPDIEASLKLNDGKRLTPLDLGTKYDSQYVVAEKALLRKHFITSFGVNQYSPFSANLKYALKK